MDNDAYGHVNNVLYYSWYDTAVNSYLIERGTLDIAASPFIGLVVETGCRYHSPISYPQRVTIGLRVVRLGTSSVRYELAAFRDDAADASAEGFLVHVYVDRATMRPAPIPAAARAAMRDIQREA
jgi:acyl-CoA thioester hydrolase